MTAGFDWASFEDAVMAGLARAVRSAVASDPDEDFYAAGLAHVYREADGVIGAGTRHHRNPVNGRPEA